MYYQVVNPSQYMIILFDYIFIKNLYMQKVTTVTEAVK